MAKGQKDALLGMIRDGRRMTLGQQVQLAFMLSLPAILAQTSSMLMQYIDTGMVGRLGANPSASIGLIATSTWIIASGMEYRWFQAAANTPPVELP